MLLTRSPIRSQAAGSRVASLTGGARVDVCVVGGGLAGMLAAYLIARRRFPGRSLVITLIELPLVLPPAVAGLGLLATFGRLGLLGEQVDALGIDLAFTQLAVVLAIAFVGVPRFVRVSRSSAITLQSSRFVEAAIAIGCSPRRVALNHILRNSYGVVLVQATLTVAAGISTIAAPVVPMKLARTAPMSRKTELFAGVAARSPEMRMPPAIVKRLKSKIIKGMYSARSVSFQRCSKVGPTPPLEYRNM